MSFETPLQNVMYLDKYSRYDHGKGRRERWEETVNRVYEFFYQKLKKHFNGAIPTHITSYLIDAMEAFKKQEIMPSLRILQMAGPALERCNVGAYNCAYLPLESPRDLADLLYILMQGTGVGFSVERDIVANWPIVKPSTGEEVPLKFLIEDTTEGWCSALLAGISIWLNGGDVEYDYSQIRPFGSPLKTKGGKASGPAPLRRLLEFTRKTIKNRAGLKLRPIDLHDIACYCGQIVQVGGVRRAALISLSNVDDKEMRNAKNGKFWLKHPQRMMANNSVAYRKKPDFLGFNSEWKNLQESGSGERGIFNAFSLPQILPARRNVYSYMGLNPCGEIILRPRQFCNLSAVVVRPNDTEESIKEKLRLATFLGILQSTLTDFHFISPAWKVNCEAERLLGVDITGQFDNIELFSNAGQLDRYRYTVVQTAERLAQTFGIKMPAATTCIKPSGNSAQLLNVSSGVHPRYAPYYIRRIRIGAGTTMHKFLTKSGVPNAPEVGQEDHEHPSVYVFDFPVKSPGNGPTRKDVSALDQLEHWKLIKLHYTEHNPSCTIYVKEDEWDKVKEWVTENINIISGLSFLPYDGGNYKLAPYQEITEEEYTKLEKAFPKLDFEAFYKMDKKDDTTVTREYQCTGDSCEI